MSVTLRSPAFLQDLGVISPLGVGGAETLAALLFGRRPQITMIDIGSTCVPALAVARILPSIPSRFARFDCRNNRLLLAAFEQIAETFERMLRRYSAARFGVVIGTCTSGIVEGERAVAIWTDTGAMPAGYDYHQQTLGGGAEFLSDYLHLGGPALTVSTTCSSGANALIAARRLLRLGVCDVVLAGGVDALCATTLSGFKALGALSPTVCNPFSRHRDGTCIGEGAALFLLSREPGPLALLGAGASCDAYHISAPRPDGAGAIAAMQYALRDAGLDSSAVDYVNLHGTATLQNDAMESKAMSVVFPEGVACSSSKSLTGHCLGAAGAIEAGLCWLLLSAGNPERRLPPHCWDGAIDFALPVLSLTELENPEAKRLQCCLSNSFAFGGNNVSLLIGQC
jgi:3-oxoacyl-[acyl-carrier-protein] synthase I